MRKPAYFVVSALGMALLAGCQPGAGGVTGGAAARRLTPPTTAPATPAAAPAPPAAAPVGATNTSHGLMPTINNSLIPVPGSAYSGPRQRAETYPVKPGDGTGAFRISANYSHFSYDDPIVFPGQPGKSHLHVFFGNSATNAYSTTMLNGAPSNNDGGTLNRTAYWVPAVIDTATGAPIQPSLMQVYYKTGYNGVRPQDVQPFPAGLKMIAGDATRTTVEPGPEYSHIINWECNNGDGGDFDHLPTTCETGTWLVMEVKFPQCWDGKNLDSADHKSHMAYPSDDGAGCPADHPVAVPEITQRAIYTVPASGTSTWRLSSDNYSGGPAGYSGHADWFNGWDQTTMETWVKDCDNAAVDCSMDLLGNGQMLY